MSSTNSERFTAPDGSLIALADCNNFYVSCERLARPDLRGKPVVVLSNNDGCIVSRSNEAKALGIPMGEAEFKIRDVLHRHKVAVFSSNYALYGDISHRVMSTLETMMPQVEVYSIDEAFLPLEGALTADPVAVTRQARDRVRQWIGVPISIGIAPTKVLAKIANHVAKKYPAYGGVFDLSACRRVDALLKSIPTGEIWGIGRRNALKLHTRGIYNALQLRDAEPGMIRKLLTIGGLNILLELRGIPAIACEDAPPNRRTILSSRSFGRPVTEEQQLAEAVGMYTARAAEKLRAQGLQAQGIAVHIRTSRHTPGARYDETTGVPLQRATADTAALIKAAHVGLRRIYQPGFHYAKAGVMLFDLTEPGKRQSDLLTLVDGSEAREKARSELMAAVDLINRRHGRRTVRFAGEGVGATFWRMRRERLSPRWTTEISELLQVH